MFSLHGDELYPVQLGRFEADYFEADLQRWSDVHPVLLNDGQPMISLGTEVPTKHYHYIDNLHLGGNGMLVVKCCRAWSVQDISPCRSNLKVDHTEK
jgi:hypothetical protein